MKLLGALLLAICATLCAACSDSSLYGDDLSRAREAITEKNWSLAERLLERYLREGGGERWQAWLALLQCVNAVGRQDRASMECLEAMLEEFGKDDAKLAYILERMGRTSEAMRQYDRAADAWSAYLELSGLTPQETVAAWRNLAAMQQAQRLFDAAEDSLRECLALPFADNEKILCLLDLADQNMGRGNYQEVADLAQQILDSEPDDKIRGLAGYLQADALEQLGQEKEALRKFEAFRDLYPNVLVMDHRIELLRDKNKKSK